MWCHFAQSTQRFRRIAAPPKDLHLRRKSWHLEVASVRQCPVFRETVFWVNTRVLTELWCCAFEITHRVWASDVIYQGEVTIRPRSVYWWERVAQDNKYRCLPNWSIVESRPGPNCHMSREPSWHCDNRGQVAGISSRCGTVVSVAMSQITTNFIFIQIIIIKSNNAFNYNYTRSKYYWVFSIIMCLGCSVGRPCLSQFKILYPEAEGWTCFWDHS